MSSTRRAVPIAAALAALCANGLAHAQQEQPFGSGVALLELNVGVLDAG